jgi:predicted membrane GTPase involved in stress response
MAASKAGQQAALVTETGAIVKAKITKLMGFEGLKRIDLEEASAGNIVAVSLGLPMPTLVRRLLVPMNRKRCPD